MSTLYIPLSPYREKGVDAGWRHCVSAIYKITPSFMGGKQGIQTSNTSSLSEHVRLHFISPYRCCLRRADVKSRYIYKKGQILTI